MSRILVDFFEQTGIRELFSLDTELFGLMVPGKLIMIAIACLFIYLAVKKGYEPYLLIPIAFGMLLANLPLTGMLDGPLGNQPGGLLYYLYQGTALGIYPPLIFLCIGAGTDFGPLIANPKSLLLGAAAQLGIFVTFLGAIALGFTALQAASIGIIGGADGDGGDVSDPRHFENRRFRSCCLFHRDRGRCSPGQAHVCADQGQGQSADRRGGCVGRSHGCPGRPEGGPEIQPVQFPAHARHGTQCRRGHRLSRGSRPPAQFLQLRGLMRFELMETAWSAGRCPRVICPF